MVGKWEGEVVAGGVKDITVELTRLLAKISFSYSMGADFAFTPTSVTLKNAPSVSQVEAPTGQLTGVEYKTIPVQAVVLVLPFTGICLKIWRVRSAVTTSSSPKRRRSVVA